MTDPQGPGAGEGRVLRGGSWFSGARRVRSAMRGRLAPDKRLDNVGFRLALTPQQ
ncbi:MAG: SUMF1/EgtB/PvdO family nonheme iron enzyme [Ottowia sp.]|nr:SUMF1/EgtB/PvdO family nonheme iron enzyme [Ottowia sp.]